MDASQVEAAVTGLVEPASGEAPQRQFFDYAGPLYSVVISPAAGPIPLKEMHVLPSLAARSIASACSREPAGSTGEILEGVQDRFKASATRRSSIGHPQFPALRVYGLR